MDSRRVPLCDDDLPPGRLLWCGLMLLVGLLLALSMCGCATTDCPPCEPIVSEIPVPVYPEVPDLPPLELEPLPDPPDGAGPGWWVELQSAIAEREAQLRERIDELMEILRKIAGG